MVVEIQKKNAVSIQNKLGKLARLGLIFIGLCFSGCGHFQPGIGPELPFRSMYVAPVKNSSFCSSLTEIVTPVVLKTLQNRLPCQITNEADCEAVLTIEILSFSDESVVLNPKDTSLTTSFAENIRALCSLISKDQNKVYFKDKIIDADLMLLNEKEFGLSREQAKPQLAENLARKVVESITGLW